jgi:hypothetical protein
MAIVTQQPALNASLPISEANVTNLTTDLGAKTAKATLTTKGDIYAASAASTPARVAVGTDAQVLTADAASAAGVKWAPGSADVSTLHARYAAYGSPDTITPGPEQYLTWIFADGANTLLDLTDPKNPLPTVAGLYAISGFVIIQNPAEAGKYVFITLELDATDLAAGTSATAELASAGSFADVYVAVASTWYLAADQSMHVGIYSEAIASLSVNLFAYVQRIS